MAIKLFFFDCEGTIFQKQSVDRPGGHGVSLWARVFYELGQQALDADNELLHRWERKELSYVEWCEYSLRLQRKFGLTEKKFISIVESIPYNPGVENVIETLHEKGITTAIISGGYVEQVKRAQRKLRMHHAYGAADLYWDKDGGLEHWNIFPSDYAAKVDYVELLRKERGVKLSECAFAGDGKNDVPIASHMELSFAYQGHAKLRECATHCIDDFREILDKIKR